MKVDLAIEPELANRYRIESYFFIPRSLGISRHTYPREAFYSDVQAYIRLKTPLATLAELSVSGPISLAAELSADPVALAADQARQDSVSNELRLFGCITRAQIRNRNEGFAARLRGEVGVDLGRDLEKFASDLGDCIGAWRGLAPLVAADGYPRVLLETFQYVDEFFSITVETRLSELIKDLDEALAAREIVAGARALFRARILSERAHRRGANYSLDGEDDEHFAYRAGKLKKFASSVLWLEITKEKEGGRLVNFAAAVAAGIAMLFAVLATILSMNVWLVNTSGFVVAAVITYMLKDRIKDWLRIFFAKRLTRYLFDYSVKVRDPVTGVGIGLCRESMTYVKAADIPDIVMQSRRGDAKVLVDAQAKPEVVIRYEKEVRLNAAAGLERVHRDRIRINDIIRFSLTEFLQRADDPVSHVALLDTELDEVKLVPFRKVYHVNLVLVLRAGNDPDDFRSVKRVRVVFDKDSIKRIDEVSPPTAKA